MRLLAGLVTLVLIGAAALAGQELWSVVKTPEAREVTQATGQPDVEIQPAAQPQRAVRWPALFGELEPPAPPEPPAAEPEPPKAEPQPPSPPLASLGYTLKGLVSNDRRVWALVSHPAGEFVLRVGDELQDGLRVVRIDPRGLWIDTGRDSPELLGFEE